MNQAELTTLIQAAATGNIDAYIKLYQVVYIPLYKIAALALCDEQAAADAVTITACEGFSKLPVSSAIKGGQFIEWIIKIHCGKIREMFHSEKKTDSSSEIANALSSLSDIERLVLAVSTVCSCKSEKTARLCGYTEDTVGVCLTNAEVKLRQRHLG